MLVEGLFALDSEEALDDCCSDEAGDAAAALEDVDLVLSESELAERGAWRACVACLNLRPELFFPKRNGVVGARSTERDRRQLDVLVGKSQSAATDVCMIACPVRRECLSEALHQGESGVWGGRTMMGRDAITAALKESDPDRLNPRCGTVDGWFRHLRRRNHGSVPCKECCAAAEQAGYIVTSSAEGPLRRSIGDNLLPVEVLPDASEAMPALEPLLVV